MADIQTSTWSETAASNTATPPDGAPENHARNKVNDIQREVMGAIKREWNRSHPTVTSAGTEPAFTLSYTTAPTLVQGIIFTFLAHATPSGNVTLNVNSLGAKKVYNLQGSAQLGSAAWPANARVMVSYDTSLDSSNGGFVWLNQGYSTLTALGISAFAQTLADDADAAEARATLGLALGVGVRERLTAARTYYVRTDGSDANTGLANTAGGAFLTIQKAIDVVCDTIDNAGYDVTIQLGDGTYTGAAAFRRFVGRGAVTLQGNAGTPGNVVISTTSADAVRCEGAGIDVVVKDMELRTTTGGNCLAVSGPCRVSYSNVRFGACAWTHILVDRMGYIRGTGNYAITGAAQRHWLCTNGPGMIFATSLTITLTGTPAFSNEFAATSNNAAIVCNGNTFSGSATGTRYSASANGVINTNGGGATYLPGNAAGSTATGGQYI